jgi:hypothetical protein
MGSRGGRRGKDDNTSVYTRKQNEYVCLTAQWKSEHRSPLGFLQCVVRISWGDLGVALYAPSCAEVEEKQLAVSAVSAVSVVMIVLVDLVVVVELLATVVVVELLATVVVVEVMEPLWERSLNKKETR